MIANLAAIKALVAPALTGKVTVNVKASGTKRGAKPQPDSSSIFIYKNGFVTGSPASGTVNIVLEGGDPGWEGSVVNDGASPGFSVPQMQVLAALVDYCVTMGGDVTVNSEIY